MAMLLFGGSVISGISELLPVSRMLSFGMVAPPG